VHQPYPVPVHPDRLRRARWLCLPLVAVAAAAFVLLAPNRSGAAATLLSQGKTATASSSSSGYAANAADDGSLTTRWMAGAATYPQTWTVDLGASKALGQVSVAWQTANSRSYAYDVYGSTDNATWTLLKDRSTNKTAGTITDALKGSYRYVRVKVLSSTYGWAQVYEIGVYAAATVTPSPTPTSTPTPTSSATPTPTPSPTATTVPTGSSAGLVMTAADISLVRAKIAAGAQPWTSAWSSFQSSVTAAMGASPQVWTATTAASGPGSAVETAYDRDGHYARNAAIGYAVGGDVAKAQKARQFILAWAQGNKPLTYSGMSDPMGGTYLSHGLFGFAFAYDLTKDSGAYSAADKATITAWFSKTADALQTFLDAAGQDWVISHYPDSRPYEWSTPGSKTYYRWERYVGGDNPVLTDTAQLACAIEGGNTARIAAMYSSSYTFNVPQVIHVGSCPHNSGDGTMVNVPQVNIFKPGSGDNPGRGGAVDYMSYNERGQAVLYELSRACGRATTTMFDEIHTSYAYVTRYYGAGAVGSPVPNDTVNVSAGLPRMQIAKHLFGDAAFAADVSGQTNLNETQFLGPTILVQP
jgi:hypothetical protein